MLITQIENFQKFKFQVLAGISSNTSREKSNQILIHWCCTVLARPRTVAMLLGDAAVEPSAPSPDPSQEKRREEEHCAQGPLRVIFFSARCRPPCPRQSRPTAPRGRARTLPARPRDRRARYDLRAPLGPPLRRDSGRPCPQHSGL
jgi:hypothetical protein